MNCSNPLALALALCPLAAPASGADQRLTTDGRIKFNPRFIDGGRYVVYTVEENTTVRRLIKLELATGKSERLHLSEPKSEFSATFSDDGRIYAYCHNNGNLRIELHIRDAKTGKVTPVNPGGGFGGFRTPAFAPDGSRVIAALPERGAGQQLFSIDPDGKRTVFADNEGFSQDPAFSRDGKRVAFASTQHGNFEIYVTPAAGGPQARLTRHPGTDLRPAWSPDGRRIAFASLRDGNYEVYVIGAAGAGLRRLTFNDERDDYPVWHPNGRQLLIVSERRGRHDLYLVDAPRE